jgi:Mlc titration factor MtfA (ptsG expression regulator)
VGQEAQAARAARLAARAGFPRRQPTARAVKVLPGLLRYQPQETQKLAARLVQALQQRRLHQA